MKFIPDAPDWYWDIPEEEQKKGRCGAGSGFGEWIVPETVWGMIYTDLCQIHDKEYSLKWNPEIKEALNLPTVEEQNNKLSYIKFQADDRLLDNIIGKSRVYSSGWFMRYLRRKRAYTVHNMVILAGNSAFWKDIEAYRNDV